MCSFTKLADVVFKIHPKPDTTPEIKIYMYVWEQLKKCDLHFIVDEKDEDKSWWKICWTCYK